MGLSNRQYAAHRGVSSTAIAQSRLCSIWPAA